MTRKPIYSGKPSRLMQLSTKAQAHLMALGSRFKAACASDDYANAVALAEEALRMTPGNM